ncbi:MAG: DUF6714 family protein [Omnitrophica WOR_2 bacterium]
MTEKDTVIAQIYAAFGENEHPGENFLQGSFEGSEPFDEVGPFRSKKDWKTIEAEFLDAHASALSFFSEAGFRFYLPAYLIADLNGQLMYAEPLNHLTGGFSDFSIHLPVGDQEFTVSGGKSSFINPRRYGAATLYDYHRYRLSIFKREEAGAIVAYLQFKRDFDPEVFDQAGIDSALNLFWLDRQRSAPSAAELRQYLAGQEAYLAAVRAQKSHSEPPAPAGSESQPSQGSTG